MPELTAAEIAAMDYAGPSPGSQGITADDYRADYQEHGRRLRWWKAFYCGDEMRGEIVGPNGEIVERNGYVYIEQPFFDNRRCMLYQTKRDFFDPELGTIPKGSTGISVLPDEIELARMDRVALVDSAWIARAFIKRGADTIDDLPRKPVTVVRQILTPMGFVSTDQYAASTNGVQWASGATVGAGTMYSIEYRYLPRFEFLGDEQGVVQRGTDGSLLPQRGVVNLIQPS